MSRSSQRHSRETHGRDSSDQTWVAGKGAGYGGGAVTQAANTPGYSNWGVPTSFAVAYVSDTAANVTWIAPSDPSDGSTKVGYVLLRDGVEVLAADLLIYNDTDLVALGIYTYSIYTIDSLGRISPTVQVEYVSTP